MTCWIYEDLPGTAMSPAQLFQRQRPITPATRLQVRHLLKFSRLPELTAHHLLIASQGGWVSKEGNLTATGKDCRVREDRLKLFAEFCENVRIG